MKTKKITYLFICMLAITVSAQKVKGKVTDTNGQGISFVNVIEEGSDNGVSTDEKGNFELELKNNSSNIEISLIGFKTITKKAKGGDNLILILKEGNILEEVVITGNRSKPRTISDSPVPIDNIGVAELQATGKTTIDQMLTYSIPSYNASNQTVSDATAHFDPSELRGLGPSRTLVLINGKRKNQSALVYTSDTPGKGEVGTDFKSIPISAIKNIEVLRDGASAQYGSDAVAGVINVMLKKNVKFTQVDVNAGVTKEGDGLNIGADVNHTFTFREGGFVNASLSVSHQKTTNRSGKPGKDVLFGTIFTNSYDEQLAKGEISQQEYQEGVDLANSLLDGSHPWIKKNPSLGMKIGQPKTTKGNVFINTEYPLTENTKLYAFGGYNQRKGTSFALYRTPYWIGDPHNLLHEKGREYNGFQPTFETNINDVLFTAGSTFKISEFTADLSATYGSNSVGYVIGNTLNPGWGAGSPTDFNAGGYSFNNILSNFDINRTFGSISIGVGMEARQENFIVSEGQEESYKGKNGFKSGEFAQSFPGLQPINTLNKKRANLGAYLTSDWDISDKLLFGGAVRYENFSDFGGNVSWKLSSRYKFNEVGTLRTSYSTGFRAPSLHQIYYSSIISLPGDGGKLINQGNFKNTDKVVKDLGVPELFAETSRNFSAGFTVKTSDKITISLDYYNVKINDRVLLTGQITEANDKGTLNTEIQQILKDNQVGAAVFFLNTLHTTTQGFDYGIHYQKIKVGRGKMGINTSLNVNHTSLNGIIKVPSKLKDYTKRIFNREEQSRITSARPNLKFLYGANFKIKDFTVTLSNTYFGEVTWKHEKDVKKDQTFSGKTLTDLSLGYSFTSKISVNLNVNNLLDVYPDSIDNKGDISTDLGGRFKHPWEVNQFGFSGATFKGGITYKF